MSRRHAESKRLFVEALTVPPGEREAFLLESCEGDESLREEVESLLRHHDELKVQREAGEDDRPRGLRGALHSVVRAWVDGGDEPGDAPPPPEQDSSDRPTLG